MSRNLRKVTGAVVALAVASSALAADPDAGTPEVDLLAAPAQPSVAEVAVAKEQNLLDEPGSFGEALSLLRLETTWSGYGELVFKSEPGKPPSFLASHFNPIMLARMGELVSAEIEIEVEPDGLGVEYAVLDLELNRALVVRAGKFLVPFGQYNEVLHPSFRWNMATRPLVFREVVPEVWNAVGVQAKGTLALSTGKSFDYAVYVVNGLGGGPDFLAANEVSRSLRTSLEDNNSDKAAGARLGLGLFTDREVGAVRLGLSAYSGAVDDAGLHRLSIAGADLSVKLGPLLFRGEAVQSFLGSDRDPLVPFERGLYAQLTYAYGRANVSGRWDWAETAPLGGPLVIKRQAAFSAGYAPSSLWSLRGEVAVPLAAAGPLATPSFTAMVSFSF